MADISKVQAELPVGITGLSSAGIPTTPVSGSTNGDLGVSDGLSSGGTQGAITLTTANTAIEVKVGASRLTNRKSVTFTPLAAGIYWGYTSAVTTATGTPLFINGFTEWSLDATDASAAIFVVCATAGVTGRVTECP